MKTSYTFTGADIRPEKNTIGEDWQTHVQQEYVTLNNAKESDVSLSYLKHDEASINFHN